MADKAISQLNAATSVNSLDLFVLEQSGEAKKLTGQILENWLVSFADGHGGIQSISKTSTTGTNPVIDTYTIVYADETTSTFTVTNGMNGVGEKTTVKVIKPMIVNVTNVFGILLPILFVVSLVMFIYKRTLFKKTDVYKEYMAYQNPPKEEEIALVKEEDETALAKEEENGESE